MTKKKTTEEKSSVPSAKRKITKKTGTRVLKLVPDTSIIIEGLLSKKIEKKKLRPNTIIIHEAVMAELESQANKNRETGFLGLEEVKKLRDLGKRRVSKYCSRATGRLILRLGVQSQERLIL